MYFGEIGACSWHLTSQAEAQKKKTTHCPKTCVVFSLVIRKLSFLFELCVFFSEQCILTSDIRPALSEITLETWDHF